MMKIICSKEEKEWLEKVLIDSKDCGLEYHCNCKLLDLNNPAKTKNMNPLTYIHTLCKQCIEENINFEIKE